MNILIAPDKFKGSLTAIEVGKAIERGIKKFNPAINTSVIAMADGGEGTLEAISKFTKVEIVDLAVCNPLGQRIKSSYALSGNKAYIEMASSSGLELLEKDERNPMFTSSYGTGEMIAHALNEGKTEIYLFLGGSATNDMGIGMAAALGYEFLDNLKNVVAPIGGNLEKISTINFSRVHPALKKCQFYAVCDVDNPLYGPHGAAFVYGEQKGANYQEMIILDRGMKLMAEVLKRSFEIDVQQLPGAGAAGGFGAGVFSFLNGRMIQGIEFVLKISHFEDQLEKVDHVITGEGKIDRQTLFGKVVMGILKKARAYSIPVSVICGVSELTDEEKKQCNFANIEEIIAVATDKKDAFANAEQYVEKLANKIARTSFN